MNEQSRAIIWLVATLKASAALTSAAPGGVWRSIAPLATTMPYVIIQFQAGIDNTGAGHKRYMAGDVYLVKVIGRYDQYTALASAADAIDAALDRKNGTTADGRVLAAVCETTIAYEEVTDGATFSHLGATFRLWTQPLSGS
jgi:hypothetical protein